MIQTTVWRLKCTPINQAEKEVEFAIIGLGNPGKQYERTRHNVGFMVIDELSRRSGIRLRRSSCESLIAITEVNGVCLLLAKPLTFMNLSGRAVNQIVSKYGLSPERLLIVIDDANLPIGRLRIRLSGSHGGHKGLKSVIEALGTETVPRLRIGIGSPPPESDIVNFVLSPFEPQEWEIIKEAIVRAADAATACAIEGLERAMSKFNA